MPALLPPWSASAPDGGRHRCAGCCWAPCWLGCPLTKWLEFPLDGPQLDGDAIFFTVYYYLTINHLVRLLGSARYRLGGGPPPVRRLTADDYQRTGAPGLLYWHATDIIWLTLFPFFYVTA